ncbi:MAG: hypothetical protein JWQ17_4056 [Tardiphaga sp.]|nr:hypothetical protein [Tardiphaga sp.]
MPPNDKTKDTAPKKTPVTESKVVETAAKPETSKAETSKPETSKAETSKSETSPKGEAKPDAASKKQAMGEGQKPVTQAYKDNWNAIFGKKKKR